MSDQNKVVKFRKRRSINIGIVIFIVLFIYIAINVYIFLTKEQLIIYEVHEGTTAIDNPITALILRQETVALSEKAGFVLYYQKDGARVAKNESIYSISDSDIYNSTDKDSPSIVLTDKNDTELLYKVRSFRNSYSDDNFSATYIFKDMAQSTILDMLNNSLIRDLSDSSGGTGSVACNESGIITYYLDEFEAITSDNITAEMFKKDNYKKTSLRTTDKISMSSPVYKMITSQTWELILPLSKDQKKELKDQKKIKITVLDDNSDISAKLEIITKDSKYYAVLTMDKNMANYLGERYLDVKIDFDSEKGLKIPNTAIVDKSFYEVPLTYFTQGGDSTKKGLIEELTRENGDITTPFVVTDIYFEDGTYGYVDTKLFDAGTVIKAPKGADQFILSKTKKLSGVYNVNLGYAIFRRIEVLSQGEEYSIISDHTSSGLSAYDHIVLDGKMAVEQKIID